MTKKKQLNELKYQYNNNIPNKIIFPKKKEDDDFVLGDPPSEEEGIMAQVCYNARKILLERYLNFDKPNYTEEQKKQAIAILENIQQKQIKQLKLSGHSAIFNINIHTKIDNIAYQEAKKILDSNCIDIESGTVNENLLIKYFDEIDFNNFLFKLSPDTYIQIVLAIVLFAVSIKIQTKQNNNSSKENEENYKKIENRLDELENKLEAVLEKNNN